MVPDPLVDSSPTYEALASTMAELDWEINRGNQLVYALMEYLDGPQAVAIEMDRNERPGPIWADRPEREARSVGVSAAEYAGRQH
jgi:hypothetical protein